MGCQSRKPLDPLRSKGAPSSLAAWRRESEVSHHRHQMVTGQHTGRATLFVLTAC